MKILILGGYGTFGGRLAELLAGDARVSLLIAGRSISQAQIFCDRLAPGAPRRALHFDRDGDALAQIRAAGPDLVVDATGPFQCYGDDPYRIIKACLIHGIDYLDLADGSEFVKGVAQFDREARERGVFILSGVSSFPVLTAAVLRRLAHGLTTLDTDYEALFARRTIYTGRRTSDPAAATQPLYQRILGEAWDALPAPLRAMHSCAGAQVAAGQADVMRGRHPLARLIAWVIGFPAAGEQVPVQVVFTRNADGESWTRTFAGRSFTSLQSAGTGRSTHLLRERFGPFAFDMALVVEGATLSLVIRRWSLWGVPLPLLLAPGGDSHETVIDDRFHFRVEIRHRFIGLIVGYRGWLAIRLRAESSVPAPSAIS